MKYCGYREGYVPRDEPYPLFLTNEAVVRDEASPLLFKPLLDRRVAPTDDLVFLAVHCEIRRPRLVWPETLTQK